MGATTNHLVLAAVVKFPLLRHAKESQRLRPVMHLMELIGRSFQLFLNALFVACSVDMALMALCDTVKSFSQPTTLLNGLHLPGYGATGPVPKGGCTTEFSSLMNPNLSSMVARMDSIGAGDGGGRVLSQSSWLIRGTEEVWVQDL